MKLHEKLAQYAGSISGGVSILGSWQLCHNICLGVVALLSVIGITMTGLPLMFLEKISFPVWLLAVAMLGLTGVMLLKKTCMSRKIFMANTGLVIAGIPFKAVQSYIFIFWIMGGLLVAGSIGWAVNDKVNAKLQAKKTLKKTGNIKKKSEKSNDRALSWVLSIAVITVLVLVLVNTIAFVRLTSSSTPTGNTAYEGESHGHGSEGMMTHMKFSSYDSKMAHDHMDKDNDGMCDICGMPIDMCMESGMLECNMDPNAKIGLLGSGHTHADWKIYINAKQVDLASFAHGASELGSSFIHVDAGAPSTDPAAEKTGDTLHMHAKGVPLYMFFESVGMKFTNNCLTINEKEHCTDTKNSLKFFVNGKQNNEYGNYVFNDADKILISYGPKNEDVSKQLASITNFASMH
ncbi:MAG: hypothetical protein HY363_06355 [Candidatus Aenigmarchaeota archaeon]|nr:hypothetical protein [Candidatus Aenigmarchaeota archaeon]